MKINIEVKAEKEKILEKIRRKEMKYKEALPLIRELNEQLKKMSKKKTT